LFHWNQQLRWFRMGEACAVWVVEDRSPKLVSSVAGHSTKEMARLDEITGMPSALVVAPISFSRPFGREVGSVRSLA
jgi:hypothetical protein